MAEWVSFPEEVNYEDKTQRIMQEKTKMTKTHKHKMTIDFTHL